MINQPEKYIDDFAKAGADIITVHAESTIHLNRVLNQIKEKGIKSGVSLNPSTPRWMIENVLDDVDMILIMSVNPGFGGQKFIPSSIDKIKDLKQIINNSKKDIKIQIDGGVTADNIYEITKAGAQIVVAGTAVFGGGNIEQNIKQLINNQYKE
jgi:ribulose-phosphate 3-epimerase